MQTRPLCRALMFLLSTACLQGCNGPSLESDLKAGKSRLEAGDSKQALIHAKSALQQQQGSAEARLLLGRALLESGEAAAAATEFKKLGKQYLSTDESASVLLARALLESGQHRELIETFQATQLSNPTLNAELLAHTATANLALGNSEAAKSAIEKAVAAAPNSEYVLLTKSDIEYASGNLAKTQELLGNVIAANADSAQAWLRLGAFRAREKADVEGAIEAFSRALKSKPDFHTARSNLIFMLLAKGDIKSATEQVAQFRKALPSHPQTAYFEAQIALKKKDYPAALELIQKALKSLPDNVLMLSLAGEIQAAVGQWRQAEQSLTRGMSLAPNSTHIRQTLAQVYLQTNRADAALNILKPLLDQSRPASAKAQFLAGEANLMRGNLSDSISNLEAAAKLDPGNTLARIQLILTKGKGKIDARDTAKALRDLASADKGILADLALINLLVQVKDYTGALAAVDALEPKSAKSALPFNLRGALYFQQRDFAAARKALQQALSIEPKSLTAIGALADIDAAEGKPEDAKNRYREYLKTDPKNYQATMGLARFLNPKTQGDEYSQLIKSAIEIKPDAVEPRIQLIRYYLDRNDAKTATSVAQAAAVALPENPDILDWLGKSQIAASDINQAVNTYGRLVTLQSQSPHAYLRLAGALLAAKDTSAAKKSLNKALLVDPNFFPAQEALVRLAVTEKRKDEAISIARSVQKQQPKDPAGYLLEGDIESQFGRLAAAADVYRAALKSFPSPLIAIKLYGVMLASGQEAEAEKFVGLWSSAHPKDKALLAFAGDSMLSRQNYGNAEKYFRGVLSIDPNNPASLNNVAWLLIKQNKPGATELAERASKLQPDSPAVLDTLAQALSAEKAYPRAIASQKRAVELAPRDLGLKLNLAKIYLASGDKAAAKEELTALKALGDRFPAQAEVTQLLTSL